MKIWSRIAGKKTYVLGIASMLYAVTGLLIGKHDYNTTADIVQTALVSMTIRHGIK